MAGGPVRRKPVSGGQLVRCSRLLPVGREAASDRSRVGVRRTGELKERILSLGLARIQRKAHANAGQSYSGAGYDTLDRCRNF